MVTTSLLATLSFGLLAIANPLNSLTPRQKEYLITPDTLKELGDTPYWIEWYPHGCGKESDGQLSGAESTLADCRSTDMFNQDAPTAASIRIIIAADDDRQFKYRIFGTNNCNEQISEGDVPGHEICFTVPIGPEKETVGAVIVYT